MKRDEIVRNEATNAVTHFQNLYNNNDFAQIYMSGTDDFKKNKQ